MGKPYWVTKACGIFLLWAAAAVALPAQTAQVSSTAPIFTTLLSLDGTDGDNPNGLVQGIDGNFYGTTYTGGANDNISCGTAGDVGCGTAFKISSASKLTTLYNFCSQSNCSDGASPQAGLIQGTDGAFYGTTGADGTNYNCDEYPCGTVFKITSGGTLTTLHSFGGTDGSSPEGGLVQGTDGNFYGTTIYGGASLYYGTVFKITPSGNLTTLHSFTGGRDGANPVTGLVQGTDGSFYGTAYFGARCQDAGYSGCGTVFKITPSGMFTTLYAFDYSDGAQPSGLIQATDGNFYGTTQYGGTGSAGTVFKITPSGKLTTLYSFCALFCADGDEPVAGLVEGTDGNFYGTLRYGGASGGNCSYGDCGTVFQITPGGEFTMLHSFDYTDGAYPLGLVQDTSGTFYGTTSYGGAGNCSGIYSGCGTVFSLSVGLGPFVKTNPVAGKVGATVGILGTNLTGATGVKFNGIATAFRVVSSSFIEAKVPSGATTGKVTVQLPSGPLSGNVPFIVLR